MDKIAVMDHIATQDHNSTNDHIADEVQSAGLANKAWADHSSGGPQRAGMDHNAIKLNLGPSTTTMYRAALRKLLIVLK